MEAISHRLKIE